MGESPLVSVITVSHGQEDLVVRLLASLEQFSRGHLREVILIENQPSRAVQRYDSLSNIVRTYVNARPRGLAKNVNAGAGLATGDYLCILNPDVYFAEDVFSDLLQDIQAGLGDIVAPLIVDGQGRIQDSARHLPTPRELLARRLVPKYRTIRDESQIPDRPEWIGGMFMLMPIVVFRQLGGWDERFFLYFEDVDYCARASLAGYRLYIDKRVRAVHEARRASMRHPWYLWRHIVSAFRFFRSPTYRAAREPRSPGRTGEPR